MHRAGDLLESPAMSGAAGRVRTCDACAFNAALYQAELQRQVWSGVRDSNSFGQLGRLEHNPYANPAKAGRPCGIRTQPGRLERAVTSPEVQRSISIFHSEADFVPLPRQEARGVPTWRPGTAILCPAHPWRIRFRRACSRRRRWLRYGADSRLRTGDLHLGKVSFCQLNYVRKSGGSYPPPEDHIPELLRSNRPAYRSGHRPEWAGFHLVGCPGNDPGQPRHRFYRPLRVLSGIPPQVFSTARPQKQGARTAFANPGSLVWNRNLLITQDDYMVILPDCLLSLSQLYPKGRHGKWMQAAYEFVSFSAPRMETADAKRHGRPNRPVRCCDIASL